MDAINFPNLHIHLNHVGKLIYIGNFSIAYYGIIIALGMLLGIGLACLIAKRTGQKAEDYYDLALIAIICSVIGARIYYVAFRWEWYRGDIKSIFNIREGGLAIYGGVIAAIITVFIFSKVKKLSFGQMCDTAGMGLILGQIIGRWGNFFNREAFGGYTNNLFAMQLPVEAVRSAEITEEQWANVVNIDGVAFIQVHPTFLYESLWNLALLIILLLLFKKKAYEGEIFLGYLMGYGCGRFWIEALRTDQLWIPGTTYPVSRALAATLAIVCFIVIVVNRVRFLHFAPQREKKTEK